MQYHAARPVYSALLAAGVEIHEYASSFLHAKVAVVDAAEPQAWATVGSSNLDPLSLLLAREANVVVHRQRLCPNPAHQAWCTPWPMTASKLTRQTMPTALGRSGRATSVAYALMRLALWSTGNRY